MKKTILVNLLLLFPNVLLAEEAGLNSADTAWILTSTALVLFMTLPGLALFYGGLVSKVAGLMMGGLRVKDEQEVQGLDIVCHEETGYNL